MRMRYLTINNRPISTLSESEHLRLNAATSLVLSRVCGHNVVLIDRLDASDNVHKGPMIEYLKARLGLLAIILLSLQQ